MSGHTATSAKATLEALAAQPAAALSPDFYGDGGAIAELEARVTAILGAERGMFVINGVTAQLAVLKTIAALARVDAVGVHPLSHIDQDEKGAIRVAAGLTPVRLGETEPFTVSDLERVKTPLAAVVVELPLRRAGYLLSTLKELRELSIYCRARGVWLHFDGARIWEAASGYGISVAELASLADSTYVSFYKGMGGIGGAMVVGSASFVEGVEAWKTRFGGTMFTAFPYALAALAGLDRHLPAMPEYVRRARDLAEILPDRLPLHPTKPHVNAFRLLLPGPVSYWTERQRTFAVQRSVWLFNVIRETRVPGYVAAEIVIGDACRTHTVEQAADWIEALVSA